VGRHQRFRQARNTDNLDQALAIGADAVVIAPLAIDDLNESDIVRFF
jgi:hypothetical protein